MSLRRLGPGAERAGLKVLLLLGWLDGGGAERVSIHLLNRSPPDLDVRMGLLRRAGPYLPQADPARLHVRPWRRAGRDPSSPAREHR